LQLGRVDDSGEVLKTVEEFLFAGQGNDLDELFEVGFGPEHLARPEKLETLFQREALEEFQDGVFDLSCEADGA